MSNIDKRPFRADGGNISTGRLREIADNPYGDEEKCWLAKRVLVLLDELEAVQKTSAARLGAIDTTHKMFQRERGRAEAAEKRIAELEAREVILPQRMDPEGYHIDEAYMVAAEDGENLDRDEVIEAMRAAGIRINGEG